MIKEIKAVLLATLLAFATIGGAYAVTEADIATMEALVKDDDKDDLLQIADYIYNKDGDVTIIDGEAAQKFNQGLALFTGIAAPATAVYFVYGAVDPADSTVLVSAYDVNGTFLGAEWFGSTMVDAAAEYTTAGI